MRAQCPLGDYLAAEDVSEFLPPIFVHAMRGTIQCSEERIATRSTPSRVDTYLT